jgi:glycosyltransferase involved in cell wall biosynthesis
MDVILDGTPMLGTRTGIGHYVAHLHSALSAHESVRTKLYSFTIRHGSRPIEVPPGDWVHRRVPARALHELWRRANWPPAEMLLPRADVVHATNFIGAPTRRTARVVTVHDLAFSALPASVHPRTLRASALIAAQARTAQAVLTPTAVVAQEVVDVLGVAADRVHVTPLGVDPSWFDQAPPDPGWRSRHGVPVDYLLAVGTQEPRKNLAALVAAHRHADGRSLPLVLVGPPGWGKAVDASPDVVVLPYLPAEQLRALVAGARALVFPTRYEGFGLPGLEALAAGTPVVANDLPVLREVLGDCGTYVDADDPDALADALVEASGVTDSAAGRRRRRDRAATFTWARCADATVAAYERALDV